MVDLLIPNLSFLSFSPPQKVRVAAHYWVDTCSLPNNLDELEPLPFFAAIFRSLLTLMKQR